jgi:hypothetical protein
MNHKFSSPMQIQSAEKTWFGQKEFVGSQLENKATLNQFFSETKLKPTRLFLGNSIPEQSQENQLPKNSANMTQVRKQTRSGRSTKTKEGQNLLCFENFTNDFKHLEEKFQVDRSYLLKYHPLLTFEHRKWIALWLISISYYKLKPKTPVPIFEIMKIFDLYLSNPPSGRFRAVRPEELKHLAINLLQACTDSLKQDYPEFLSLLANGLLGRLYSEAANIDLPYPVQKRFTEATVLGLNAHRVLLKMAQTYNFKPETLHFSEMALEGLLLYPVHLSCSQATLAQTVGRLGLRLLEDKVIPSTADTIDCGCKIWPVLLNLDSILILQDKYSRPELSSVGCLSLKMKGWEDEEPASEQARARRRSVG